MVQLVGYLVLWKNVQFWSARNWCHILVACHREPLWPLSGSASSLLVPSQFCFLLGLLIPNQLQSIPPIYPISTLNDKNKGRINVLCCTNVINYWGHSTTTWTNFDPFLTPYPLEWTSVDLLHTPYLCPHGQQPTHPLKYQHLVHHFNQIIFLDKMRTLPITFF